jgi:drug/metabolite transporter (DMT)-like permease
VTTIAGALQPVFTIVLAMLLLSESLTWLELLGIVLAIVSALMLSFESVKSKSNNLLTNPNVPPYEQ